MLALAEAVGASVLNRREAALWGGYSGYRADLAGHVRERAAEPALTLVGARSARLVCHMADSPPLRRMLETALYADDLDEAERFYGGLLGLERVARVGERHVFFRCGPGVLLVFNPHETASPPGNPDLPVPPHGAHGPGHACFAATADDLARWRSRLADAGVDIEADFAWPNGARSVYVRDPAGNSIEFAEPALWGYDG